MDLKRAIKEWSEHKVEAVVWLCLGIPTVLWWKESILWVACMSLYANFKTAISAHEAHMAREEES